MVAIQVGEEVVEFPDDMSDDDISVAIQSMNEPQAQGKISDLTETEQQELIGDISPDERGVIEKISSRASFALQDPDINTGESIKSQSKKIAKLVINEGVNLAKLPVGLLLSMPTGFKGNVRSAAFFGGVDFLQKTANELLEGESLGEAAKEGAKSGLITAGVDLALGEGLRTIGKGAKGLANTSKAKALRESNAAKELLDVVEKQKRNIKNKMTDFGEKIFGKTQEQKDIVKLGVKSASAQIDELSKQVDELTLSIKPDVDKGINKVTQHLRGRYDEVLGTAEGSKVLNITDNLEEISEVLGIKAGVVPSNKIANIYEQILPRIDDEAIRSGLKAQLDDIVAKGGGEISLRNAHWLKKSLNSVGRKLKNDPVTQEIGNIMLSTSKKLSDNIDSQVGGQYAELTGKWRNLKQVENAMDTGVGRMQTVFDEQRRKGTSRVVSNIERAAKQGKEITDEMIKETNDTIFSLYAQADLLDQNGFPGAANSLRTKLSDISKSTISIQKAKTAKSAMFKLAKEGSDDAVQMSNAIKNLELESGQSFEDVVGGYLKEQDDVLSARKRLTSIAKAKSKSGRISAKQLDKLNREEEMLKGKVVDSNSIFGGEVLGATIVATALRGMGLIDNKTTAMLPLIALIHRRSPNISNKMLDIVESNVLESIANKKLSEGARDGAKRLLTEYIRSIREEGEKENIQ